jgi:hypothetical protein
MRTVHVTRLVGRRHMKFILLMFVLSAPGIAFADQVGNVSLPQLPGWSTLRWGMTKEQLEKASGRQLQVTTHSDMFNVGSSTYYGHVASVSVHFDKKGGLSGVDFVIALARGVPFSDQLNDLHGQLEADLGKPSLDGRDTVGPNDGFNTLWCSPSISVFLSPFVSYKQSTPSGVIVNYMDHNPCKQH